MIDKKSLREDYKQQKFKIGVFQVRNLVNDKILIGSSPNLEAIWNRIRTELKFGNFRNEALQEDWNRFGEDMFRFEVLAEIKQQDNENRNYTRDAKELALLYVQELQPFGMKGYHKTPV